MSANAGGRRPRPVGAGSDGRDDRVGAAGGRRPRPPQPQRPPRRGDEQLEDLGSAGVLGGGAERVDQPGVAADLAEQPPVGECAPADRGPAAAGRRRSAPSPPPARPARSARSSRRRRTRRARPRRRGCDTRPTPTATLRTATAASPSSGWTMVVATPAATAAQATARGKATRNPSPTLDEAEQADELDHGDGSDPGHQAERQPAQLPPLVDARPEQRPRQQAGGDERAEGERRGAPSRRSSRRR